VLMSESVEFPVVGAIQSQTTQAIHLPHRGSPFLETPILLVARCGGKGPPGVRTGRPSSAPLHRCVSVTARLHCGSTLGSSAARSPQHGEGLHGVRLPGG
jgi:hypothetical protein